MRDFSLGYDLHGEHFGLGVSLSEPPERFGVREWRRDGDCVETLYVPERTCVPRIVPRTFNGDIEPSFWQAVCDCGWVVGEDGTPNLSEFEHVDNYCGGCGARVVVG